MTNRIITYLLILTIMLALTITDFTAPGISWEQETLATATPVYPDIAPDIAIDLTRVPSAPQPLPYKRSMKRLTRAAME